MPVGRPPAPANAMLSEQECVDLWRRAADSEYGIAVPTTNCSNFVHRMYLIRARYRQEEFFDLMLRPRKDEVWIIHKPIVKTQTNKAMNEEDLDEL